MKKNAKIDKQALVEMICYLLFAFVLLFLVLSGQYLNYVTPRMKPYLLFAAAVLLVWARTAMENLYIVRHRRHCLHCFVLVFPLLMLISPRKSVSVSAVSTPAQSIATVQTLRSSSTAASPTPPPTAEPAITETAESAETLEPPEAEEQPTETPEPVISDDTANTDGTYETVDFLSNTTILHGYDAANRHITISDAEFYTWMDVIWASPADYDGWTMTVTGEVDKASREMDANEFIPARLIMTCCAADLTPCGFVCKWEQADTLVPDSWVTVTGTIYQRQYSDHSEPQLQVQSVVAADPVEGYIYPYY